MNVAEISSVDLVDWGSSASSNWPSSGSRSDTISVIMILYLIVWHLRDYRLSPDLNR